MPRQLQKVGDEVCEVVYKSPFFTVVRAETKVRVGNRVRVVHTEGIARRSWRDPFDECQGSSIAAGRASKAMKAKLEGKRIWKRIYKATDLLSNG